MKIWNIDYRASTAAVQIVSVKGYATEAEAIAAPQKDDVGRLIARTPSDLASLSDEVLLALATKMKVLGCSTDVEVIWSRLNPPKKEAKKKTEVLLQSAISDGTSEAGDDAVNKEGATAPGKRTKMATKKAATKKAATKKDATKKAATKTKTKTSTGPRGEKTLKVKKLLEHKSGCTRAEVLEATGWPAVSMQAMAEACRLKLRQEKVEKNGDVRAHTRYYGS